MKRSVAPIGAEERSETKRSEKMSARLTVLDARSVSSQAAYGGGGTACASGRLGLCGFRGLSPFALL